MARKGKSPTAQTYPVEKKDERKVLSTKERSLVATIGTVDHSKNAKLHRFIDIHKKQQAWLPPPTKYDVSMAQRDRYLSPSPTRLAHKR